MEGLFRALAIDEEDIQLKALEALSEIPLVSYDTITEYVPRIGEATIRFMQGTENTVS